MKGTHEDQASLVADLRSRSLRVWRNEYAPHSRVDDLLGNELRRITVATNELPGGTIEVFIKLRGTKESANEQFFFKATRVAGEIILL